MQAGFLLLFRLVLSLKEMPRVYPHTWTCRWVAPVAHPQPSHLWVGAGWPGVECRRHQATQKQLVHLRVLQHHQLQQV